MEHVDVLASQATEGAFMHTINRDANEKYNMIITGDPTEPLEVYKFDGTKCTIRYGHLSEDLVFTSDATIKNYLTSTSGKLPREAFQAVTIADHSLIANSTKVCAMSGTIDTTTQDNTGYVYVKKGVAKTNYRIYLNEILAGSYTSGETTDYESYNSRNVAQALLDSILGGSSLTLRGEMDIHTYLLPHPPSGSPISVLVNGVLLSNDLWTVADYSGQWKLVVDTSVALGFFEEGGWTGYTIQIQGGAIGGYSVYLQDSIIKIKRIDGAEFTLRVEDTYSNEALEGIYKRTQSFEKLPARFFDGVIIEIVGDISNTFDNYWVVYDGKSNTWSETRKPGLDNDFLASTMPHRLVRTNTNEFTFCDIEWNSRKVGDEVSCSNPSFIGKSISDIFYWRNRLGFFAGENIILSKAAFFFTFWPTTATDSLDDDPIDVAGSTNEVVTLKHAVPYANTLLGMGEQVQLNFHTGNASTLTPRTLVSDPATRFTLATNCKPALVGSNAFMAVKSGDSTQIREYFVQGDSASFDAADITAHCPTYIPKNMIKMVGSSTFDLMIGLSADTPNVLYVYKYYWQGDEKVQSAWGKWVLPVNVLSISLLDEYLYLLTKGSGQVCLQKINLNAIKTGSLPLICLDRRFMAAGTYSSVTNTTTWSIPFTDTSDATYIAVQSVKGYPKAALTKSEDGTSLSAVGDFSGVAYYIGSEYLWKLDLTRFILKDANNKPYLHGHTILRTLSLAYANTGYFEVHVTATGRETDIYTFTPFYAGSPLGALVTPSGIFSDTLVQGDPQDIQISIQNNTFLPSIVTSATYEGTFYSRARKV
ncbi:hypothetical protein [Geobacter sp. SVR]|uniref:phage nozzle protein n=1 Tax=Geobacter sp. SVR TaxID=2495594 RepID=UPI001563E789|nr:hypothetical protein [Geobacter sp. SVR]